MEAATVPPVALNMQGLSLYRSPSKIMPSLPSHTPHKAGQPLPVAICCQLLRTQTCCVRKHMVTCMQKPTRAHHQQTELSL